MKENYTIQGMTCSACSQAVDKAVNKIEGVNKVSVNLLTHSMQVDFDESQVKPADILKSVSDAGYSAVQQTESKKQSTTEYSLEAELAKDEQNLRTRFLVSLVFMIPLMYIAMAPMFGLPTLGIFQGHANSVIFAFTQMLLTLPIIIVNYKYFSSGFKTLIKGNPNMDSLVAIGSSAAFLYGIFVIYRLAYGTGHNLSQMVESYSHSLYFESAAMILTLITLGKYLEAKSKGRTTDAIKKLMDLSPKTAIRIENGQEVEVPIEEVRVGDILLVKPGSSVPVDGTIVSGHGSFDESAITGESIPVEKGPDKEIIGSTILKLGSITMRAEKVGDDTAIAKIIQLVQDANATKAPIAQLADKVSGVFVPIVIVVATLATIIWLILGQTFEFSLTIGISVLIISCPCALGLATPVAIMVGTGKGASNGILIKSAEALETLHDIDSIILDKTGTITEGKPEVTNLVLLSDLSETKFLQIAASLEAPSEHPLSLAILEYAAERNIEILPANNFFNQLGKGIEAEIDGQRYVAGNQKYMLENGLDVAHTEEKFSELSEEGKTTLYFADGKQILGMIAVADKVKANSKQAIDLMHKAGIKVYMLTGDNQRTATAIGNKLGLDQVIAEVLPEDKEQMVREIKQKGGKVAMVGDGINDAPALARADVGIAIGAGTDIAIEAADIVLMKSDLLDVVNSLELSRRTIRNIKQNLFWAFFYNIILIPVAAGVLYSPFGLVLNPMIASAAMSLSSVFVVTNALRLNRFQPLVKVEATTSTETKLADTIIEEAENLIIKGENTMKKVIKIEGMSCAHCSARVEEVLNEIEGVKAKVDLDKKQADLTLAKDISEDLLVEAVVDAGYEVLEVL